MGKPTRMTDTGKVCSRCEQDKSLSEFYLRSGGKYYHSYCKPCGTAEYRSRPPERRAAYARRYRSKNEPKMFDSYLRRNYGITLATYEEMLTGQGGCAICGRAENVAGNRLAVDHCHVTGKVRGLLCTPCNTMLGSAQDDVDRLTAAAAYLISNTDILGKVAP